MSATLAGGVTGWVWSGCCRPRRAAGTAIKEARDQIGEDASREWAIEERSANNIFAVYPCEVGNHLARLDIKESEPRLAFVGHPAVGLDAKARRPQHFPYTMKMR